MQVIDKQPKLNAVERFGGPCQLVLERQLGGNASCVFASVTTLDGRSVAFITANDSIQHTRIAALSCSVMSLSEAFGREILKSQCSYNVIATHHGSIVTVRIPCETPRFALSVCVDHGENMAMALRMTLDSAKALAHCIRDSLTGGCAIEY